MQYFPQQNQAIAEKIIYAIDASNRKPVGGSVSSATGTIRNGSAAAVALSAAITISTDTVNVTVIGGTDFNAVGEEWVVDVLITLSNGEKPQGRIPLRVDV